MRRQPWPRPSVPRGWRPAIGARPSARCHRTATSARSCNVPGRRQAEATMSVLIERQGPVTTVIIDRPAARNAIDPATARALAEAFRAFEADPQAHVAVLCGSGDQFCAGADLKSFSERPQDWQIGED